MATPKATPIVNSRARRPRSPTASPRDMTAAIGGEGGPVEAEEGDR